MMFAKKGYRVIYWTPRILCIVFALFISMFALDVFSEGYTGLEIVLALFMHLVPTYIIVALLLVAWKWEWIGAIAFCGLGVYYVLMTRGRMPLITYLLIPGPSFVISLLFLLSWLWRDPDQSQTKI